jgi:hypothetical protein
MDEGPDVRVASVSWSSGDIQSLRPDWSSAKCIDFLVENGRYIQDAMVQAGWDAIESLLPPKSRKEAE